MTPSERKQSTASSQEPAQEEDGRSVPLGVVGAASPFELLVDLSPHAMAVARPGELLYANAAAIRLLGGRAAATTLFGQRAEDVLQRARARTRGGATAPLPGERSHVEVLRERVIHYDGVSVALELAAAVIAWRGAPAVHFLALDVSDRVRSAEEKTRLEAQLQHAQRLESLGRLAGGIAHDFNDLLTRILTHAELAGGSLPADSPARENLAALEAAALRGAALTAQMQTFAGTTRVVKRPVDLSTLLVDLRPLLQASLPRKIELRENLALNLPAIDADPGQLEQLVANLVSNAADAIGEARGTIGISTGVMEASSAYLATTVGHEGLPAGPYAYVVVSDSGGGVDGEIAPRIFEPFFTTRAGRSGLGLAAVMGVVRRHGGALKVESRQGEGTTVRVLLPVKAAAPRRIDEHVAATHAGAPPTTAGPWVLLVDDEAAVRRALRLGLERAGYRVIEAQDGRQAIDLYRARHAEIAAVVLDFEMPVLSGDEVLEELRQISSVPRVLISSGHAAEAVLERFPAGSFDALLPKPYGPQTLVAKLGEVLAA
jgi:signal transduction histidine kinase/CheY-like chemotaxis protein